MKLLSQICLTDALILAFSQWEKGSPLPQGEGWVRVLRPPKLLLPT